MKALRGSVVVEAGSNRVNNLFVARPLSQTLALRLEEVVEGGLRIQVRVVTVAWIGLHRSNSRPSTDSSNSNRKGRGRKRGG